MIDLATGWALHTMTHFLFVAGLSRDSPQDAPLDAGALPMVAKESATIGQD
jgi:hypothetical protein